jgi:hypothetical protein
VLARLFERLKYDERLCSDVVKMQNGRKRYWLSTQIPGKNKARVAGIMTRPRSQEVKIKNFILGNSSLVRYRKDIAVSDWLLMMTKVAAEQIAADAQ